jgi:hypothetical protein
VAAATVGYVAVEILSAANIPSPEFWQANSVWIVWLTGAAMVGGTYEIYILRGEVQATANAREVAERGMHAHRLRRQLEDSCKPLLQIAANDTQLDVLSLGVHVWRVSGDNNHLVRVADYKVHSRQPSGITWTRGKGAIGRCWRDGIELVVDTTHLQPLDGQAFMALDDDTRLGFTYSEFRRISAYVAVWATPMVGADEAFLGCVSIDCDADGSGNQLGRLVENKVVQGVVETVRQYLIRVTELDANLGEAA